MSTFEFITDADLSEQKMQALEKVKASYDENQLYQLYMQKVNAVTEEDEKNAYKILKRITNRIVSIITDYPVVHEQIYNSNEIYRTFIANVWTEKQYKRLCMSGNISESMKGVNAVRTLGLAPLIRKLTKTDNKNMSIKISKWVDSVEWILDLYNACKEEGINFTAQMLVMLELMDRVHGEMEQEKQ